MSWWNQLWKLKAPPCTKSLMWNIIEDKTPARANLRKRAFTGLTWCVLCHQDEESSQHLFLTCFTSKLLWTQVLHTLNINQIWHGEDIPSAWESWWGATIDSKIRNLLLLVTWHIWMGCNNIIFPDRLINWALIPPKICSGYEELPAEEYIKKPRNITQE